MKTGEKKKTIGYWGEQLAADYLRNKNYEIIAQNYQRPWGEVDLIAEKEGVVIFFEVKTSSKDQGPNFSPALRVNSKKGRHIMRTAKIFLSERFGIMNKAWRVDVISIVLNRFLGQAVITHFKNAVIDTQ